MERSLTDELYSKIPKVPRADIDSKSSIHNGWDNSTDNDGDLWYDDDASKDESERLESVSDMDREWQRRHEQFHTIGYRDGLMAGQEASAQEGFNIGFKESIFAGRRWGLVRGVTSALACLPDGLKKKLVEAEDKRREFQDLHESVHALSTNEVLKLFHGSLKDSQLRHGNNMLSKSQTEDLNNQSSNENTLENYVQKFQSLVSEHSLTKLHLENDPQALA